VVGAVAGAARRIARKRSVWVRTSNREIRETREKTSQEDQKFKSKTRSLYFSGPFDLLIFCEFGFLPGLPDLPVALA
jgi:hypothetical protein